MKSVLLLGVILAPFLGCRKAENQTIELKKIHEINIGIIGTKRDKSTNKYQNGFYFYWHIDLLKDSLYLKNDDSFFDGSEKASVKAGKFAFKSDSAIQKFLLAVKNFENGQKFIYQSTGVEFYCYPTHYLQYKEDSVSKILIFNDRNSTLRSLMDLVSNVSFKTNLKIVSPELLKVNSELLQHVLAISPDSLMPPPPPPVEKTIKFTPPIKNQKDLDSILRNNR